MKRSIILRNYVAMFGWGFMLLWMSMLLAFTKLYVTKGIPDTQPLVAAGIMSIFWIGGLAGCSHLFAQRCARGELRNGALFVTEWSLWTVLRPVQHRFDLFEPPPAIEIATVADSDGDPYHTLQIETPDGTLVVIAEGHSLSHVDAARSRLLKLWETL